MREQPDPIYIWFHSVNILKLHYFSINFSSTIQHRNSHVVLSDQNICKNFSSSPPLFSCRPSQSPQTFALMLFCNDEKVQLLVMG